MQSSETSLQYRLDRCVKPGDIVEIVERSMGMCHPTGVMGIVIKETSSVSKGVLARWDILIHGKIKNKRRRDVRILYSSNSEK